MSLPRQPLNSSSDLNSRPFEVSTTEMYLLFLKTVEIDVDRTRKKMNRRMFTLVWWCIIAPALLNLVMGLFSRWGWIAYRSRGQVDWLLLVFPLVYSLWVFGTELFSQVPMRFTQSPKRKVLSGILGQVGEEITWREATKLEIQKTLPFHSEQFALLSNRFNHDLDLLHSRLKHLTGFAGAVFFLIMQGLDMAAGDSSNRTFEKNPLGYWVETTQWDFAQLVTLALVLILFYLAGAQQIFQLRRYGVCLQELSEPQGRL